MKADALKYKTQYDEAIAANQELNRDLQAMTQKAERMKKMRDDDTVGYRDALAKLKSVGEVSVVLSIFPEDAFTTEGALAEEESTGFAGQVRSIPSKMMKYIRSSIHAGIVQTVAFIRSWNPQQDLQCLIEAANPDATYDQITEYQASAEPIADQICEDLGWKKD